MTLSAANIVQQASGAGVSATTHAVTLPGGTTAGNTIIVAGVSGAGTRSFTAPTGTGWVLDRSNSLGADVSRLSNVGAGATTWTFTFGTADISAWYVAEVSGLDPIDPLDATAANTAGPMGNGGTLAVTTLTTVGRSTLAFAVYGTAKVVGFTHTYSAWTNGFVEQAEQSGSGLPAVVAAVNTATDTQTYTTTATLTTTDTAAVSGGTILAYREAGTQISSPLFMMGGFEWATHAGGGSGGTGNGSWGLFANSLTPVGTWGTGYLIQAGSARNSTFGLRVVQTAATGLIRFGSQTGAFVMTAGMNVRVVSATGVVVVTEIVSSGLVRTAQLVYDATATKFGVRCGTTGTIQYQPGTTALNTWVWVDLRCITNATTWRTDWRIETAANTYTDQTQATLTGQAITSTASLQLGSNTVQTQTCDYDDVLLSAYGKPYPLGPHEVKILKVDPAGTVTIGGTTANFQTFTANGTLAAWNATTARGAVAELPPTVSASADGVAQTTVAASDYVEIPMEDYTLGATEAVTGVRMYASMWATAADGVVNCALKGWDGTTATDIVALGAGGATFSPGQPTSYLASQPIWRCGMWSRAGGWTQAGLNAAAIRFGYSTDIAPGISAVYLEVAIAKTRTRTLFGTMASAEIDPNRDGIVSIGVTAPAMGTGDTSLVYEEAGTPTTVPVPEGTLVTEQIGASFDEDVNAITMVWPFEPDPISDAQ